MIGSLGLIKTNTQITEDWRRRNARKSLDSQFFVCLMKISQWADCEMWSLTLWTPRGLWPFFEKGLFLVFSVRFSRLPNHHQKSDKVGRNFRNFHRVKIWRFSWKLYNYQIPWLFCLPWFCASFAWYLHEQMADSMIRGTSSWW